MSFEHFSNNWSITIVPEQTTTLTTVTAVTTVTTLTTLTTSLASENQSHMPQDLSKFEGSVDSLQRLQHVKNPFEEVPVEPQAESEGSSEEAEVLCGGQFFSVCVSPDQRFLVTAGSEQEVRMWDAETHIMVKSFKIHSDTVRTVQFSSDSNFIASAGDDRTICLCDIDGSKPTQSRHRLKVLKAHVGSIRSIAFLLPNGQRLASGGDDRFIRIWDVSGRGSLGSLATHLFDMCGHSGPVYCVSVSPNLNLLVTASFDQTLKLWDISTFRCLHTLSQSEGGLNACAFSPDGSTIAYGGDNCCISIWNVTERKQTARVMNSDPLHRAHGQVTEYTSPLGTGTILW